MSTTIEQHTTPMTPREQEHHLNQSIKTYQLEDWVETIPDGFRTVRLLNDLKITLLIIKLGVLLFTLLTAYKDLDEQDSGWFTVLTVALLALVAFAIIFGLTRKVVFDLENDEVRVTLLGSPVSSKALHGFSGFSYLYGGTLYLQFSDQSRIRVVDLGDEKKLENLKQFIEEALAMKANVSEPHPDTQEQPVVAESTPEHPFTDATPPGYTLEALRDAVRNDTRHHHLKKLAELLVMALNDWPRDMLEIEDTIKEMKAYFGEPMTVERLKSKRFDYSMPFNSWRLEAGASLWQMLELSAKLEQESDFDKIVARILDYYGARNG